MSGKSFRTFHLVFLFFSLTTAIVSFALWAEPPATVAQAEEAGAPPSPGGLLLEGEAAIAHLRREGLYGSLQEAVQAARYGAQTLSPEGYEFVNRANRFRATFVAGSEAGVRVSSDEDGPGQELTMKLTGYGYGSHLVGLTREGTRAQENRVELLHRPQMEGSPLALTEWFTNEPEGVEHGFVLPEPPLVARDGGPLRLEIEIGGDYDARLDAETGSIILEGRVGSAVFTYDQLHVFDTKDLQLDSHFELEGARLAIVVNDEGATYPLTIDPLLAQQNKLKAADGEAEDHFGRSVAMSGNRVVIGAPGHDVVGTDEGSAYVFVRSGSDWIQEAWLNAVDGMDGDSFGESVAIYGKTVVVGAYLADVEGRQDQGAAYVFVRDGSNWNYEDKIVASAGEAYDSFGLSVAVFGKTVLVGSPNHDGTAGAAFVFVRRQGIWIEQGKLSPRVGTLPSTFFGIQVALDRDTAVVGASWENVGGNFNQGSAYVFVREDGIWAEQARLYAGNGMSEDYFGASVAISGDTVLVGAPSSDNGANEDEGVAYVFVRNGTAWSHQGKLTSADGEADDYFGTSVALVGDTAVVGASGCDLSHEGQGAAYIFSRKNDVWSQQQRLFAREGELGDLAGNSVAVSGDTIVLGVALDDIQRRSDQGSALIFRISRGTMKQTQRLLADDAHRLDNFGSAVAISGDTMVVGATSVYADQGGPVYVFVKNGEEWSQQQKLTAIDPPGGGLGHSVALSGNTLVVGGRPGQNQVTAYVFERDGTTWSQQQEITVNYTNGDGEIYYAHDSIVAIDGDTLVIGAYNADIGGNGRQGAAHVYVRYGTTWLFRQQLTASDGSASDLFGVSVALSGDTLVVGAITDVITAAAGPGAAYVFEKSGDNWNERQKLTIDGQTSVDLFGAAVAISVDSIVVGAQFDPTDGTTVGSATVFVKDGAGWSQQQKLTMDDAPGSTGFGLSIAISGDRVVVGVPGDPVDGRISQGSAHLFVRSGTTWRLQQRLVANNGAVWDSFGFAVAIEGDQVVVGVPWDSGGGQRYRGSVRVFHSRTCPRIGLEPSVFPDATVGGKYDELVFAQGGVAPHNFSLSSGTLPPGLTLDPTSGWIAGVPATAGRFAFVITATDTNLCTGHRRYRIDVEDPCPTIVLRPPVLPEGREGESYFEELTATGGVAPYEFSVTGTRPPGLTLSPNGILSGTPTASGTFDFEIGVTDAQGCEGHRTYSLTIEGRNQPPRANAGLDQTVTTGTTVVLDGSGSIDPDGDPLTYLWQLRSVPAGSAATLSNSTVVHPTFLVDERGVYEVGLIVNDGQVDSAPDLVQIFTVNSPPIADAGLDRTVFVNETIMLDGAGSSDADDDPLSFRWAFQSMPAGSAATLSDPTAVNPTFLVDRLGAYVLALVVNDGQVNSAPDRVTLTTQNRSPVANAGPDQTVTAGVWVQLDGSASVDPEGTEVSYSWSLTTRPPGSVATLSNPSGVDPTFVADLPGLFVAELTVNDGELTSSPDAVAVAAEAPVVNVAATDPDAAEAGPDPGSLTFSRTGDTSFALVVFYNIDGTAENGADYALIPESITIPEGATSAVRVIHPVDDEEVEGDEVVALALVDAAQYDLGTEVSATATIADNDLPVVSVTASDPNASETGPDPGTFMLSRSGPTTNPLTVFFAMSGSATNGDDYDTIATSLTIPTGVATAAVTIAPVDDSDIEGEEAVVLTLTADSAYEVGLPNNATMTIADNERVVVTVTATDGDAAEQGSDPGTFTLSRTGPTTDPLDVFYAIAGSATNGDDYEAIATSTTIPSGAATATVTITPIDDPDIEGAEGAVLSLAAGPEYVVGIPGLANITIADNDLAMVSVSATDLDATEAGPTTGSFTFSRTGETSTSLDILVSRGGTATAGLDYDAVGGGSFLFSIPAGDSSASWTIVPLADNRVEGDEFVEVSIEPSLRYVVGIPDFARVTIADDPGVVNLTASVPEASEAGPNSGVFTLARSGGNVLEPLTVGFSIGGSAANNSDYAFIAGNATIPAGLSSATVNITPLADNRVEPLETVELTLIEPSVNYLVGSSARATVTIADDPAVVSVVATDPVASETGPDPGVFTFTRAGGDLTRSLQLFVSHGGDAGNGLDYESIGGSTFVVTIPANETAAMVTIMPIDDLEVEDPEDVIVTIGPLSAYVIDASGSATLTIFDNE